MEGYDAEQIGLVMRLQREAEQHRRGHRPCGRGHPEAAWSSAASSRYRAGERFSRWILTALPIFVLLVLAFTGGDYLEPMTSTLVGKIALVVGASWF